ncbi:MAG: tRNA pseudouridine(13) synthase TruD [Pseudomonadota bacterium]
MKQPGVCRGGDSYRIKVTPDAFQVYEQLDWSRLPWCSTTRSASQRLLLIEKQGLNTVDVVAALARGLGVPAVEVGYAGRKDRHALTRQWLSLPNRPEPRVCEAIQTAEASLPGGFRVLAQLGLDRKLRVGELVGNAFCLSVVVPTRLLAAARGAGYSEVEAGLCPLLRRSIARLVQHGFPNRFGSQRLDAAQVQRAERQLARRTRRRGARGRSERERGDRGWALSVLRAHLFNAVLERRLVIDEAMAPLAGDPLVDGQASGPLWGRGRPLTTDDCARFEASVLAPYPNTLSLLEHGGVSHGRRSLRVWPRRFRARQRAGRLELQFSLPAGSYATELVRSLLMPLGLSECTTASLSDSGLASGLKS